MAKVRAKIFSEKWIADGKRDMMIYKHRQDEINDFILHPTNKSVADVINSYSAICDFRDARLDMQATYKDYHKEDGTIR